MGEAFDKVARLLGLPYPGGPQISKYAETARSEHVTPSVTLPRPMITSNDLDFSFSGLKTAVRYYLEKQSKVTEELRKEVALAFENSVGEVLLNKTLRALDTYDAKTFVMGGGVSANSYLRRLFAEKIPETRDDTIIYIPEPHLTTDNAVMIGIAGYFNCLKNPFLSSREVKATGNLRL